MQRKMCFAGSVFRSPPPIGSTVTASGSMDAALHREAGRRAGAAGIQMLIAVGPMSRETADAARRGGVSEVHHYDDSKVCAESMSEHLGDGDLIVVKGSRGIHLGRVVRALQERFGEQP